MGKTLTRAAVWWILGTGFAVAQTPPPAAPRLDRAQRATLERVVAAVDQTAAETNAPADATWQVHVMRASDGSHYVAASVFPKGPTLVPSGPATMYVRLAARHAVPPVIADRSTVAEWLRGQRREPLPQRPTRVVTVPSGEIPIGGAGALDRSGASQNSAALALQEKQRERARKEQEDRERQRRAELEGRAGDASSERDGLHPFEDFALNATFGRLPGGLPVLRRSVVAGPGKYDLFIAIVGPPERNVPSTVQVFRHTIDLPAASTSSLTLSPIMLADAVNTLATPYPPDQQAAHPYALGAMEIVPALDEVFTIEERLSFAVQVINPRPTPLGKPDVSIGLRVMRVTPAGEQLAANLTPLTYNDTTLPVDFDLHKGHPLFAATSFPLQSLARGSYRLVATVMDRVAGTSTTGTTTFRVTGTPRSLLAEAPAAPSFSRDATLSPELLTALLDGLRPSAPSPGLASLFEHARARRFADALRDEPVTPSEEPVKTALRGLALMVVADSRAAAVQLTRAQQSNSLAAPVQVMLGICRAMENNDREALLQWEAAAAGGFAPGIVAALRTDAQLRLRDGAAALASVERGEAEAPGARWIAQRASALILMGREDDALTALGSADAGADREFLVLRALFSGHVHARGQGATPEGRERLRAAADRYVATDAAHAALVREWMAALSTSSLAR